MNYKSVIANKDQHRERIFKYARSKQKSDPLWPQQMQLRTCSILTGLRNIDEISAANKYELYDMVIWIDRPGISKDKTDAIDEQMVRKYYGNLIVILNDSTKESLKLKLQSIPGLPVE